MGLDWASWVSAIVFGRIRDELEHLEEGARIVVPHTRRGVRHVYPAWKCARGAIQ